ncbi:hypothetical protein KP509_22G056600 [Ceratopteris richardii]|uniref:Coiled-coil domain-containing protein 12 n=1 Tax=Ceratopteris richardii TaxID=49495 RepID=A0A8T2S7D2_CERRI|nr:hypothetical protein KP509_22G056600 [Ceratopteris richardii]
MAEGDLENAAAERRERLRALREAVELVGTTEDQQGQESQVEDEDKNQKEEEPAPEDVVRFRNYVPRDKQFQSNKISAPTIPKFEDPVATAPVVNGTEDPFLSIAPKKANWDLRRDVAKKLEKLERRTQRALIELLEEKRKQELSGEESIEGTD